MIIQYNYVDQSLVNGMSLNRTGEFVCMSSDTNRAPTLHSVRFPCPYAGTQRVLHSGLNVVASSLFCLIRHHRDSAVSMGLSMLQGSNDSQKSIVL